MSIRDQTVQGGLWTLLTKPVLQGSNFLVSIVIARLLLPADFGLVGMATVFTGFAAVFVDFGIGAAIIQQPDLTDEQLDAAFVATIGIGVVLTLAFVLSAPAVAAFYGRQQLVAITRVGALGFVLGAIGVVPRALMQRRIDIKKLALLDVGPNVAAGILSILLALKGAGIWALVLPPLASTFAMSLLPLVVGSWKPSWASDLRPLRPMLRMSVHLLGFNVINYWARNVDNLLLGRLRGERELGLYARAYVLMLLPISQIGGVFSGLMPALARMQDDKPRAKRAFMRAQSVIAAVAFPGMVGLAITAGPFVETLYGAKWVPMAPLLQVLAIAGALQSVVIPTASIFLSLGRTDILSRWGLFACTLTIVSLAIGAFLGTAWTIAMAYLVVTVLLFFPGLLLPGRLIGVGLRDLLAVFYKPVLCTILMGAVVAVTELRIVPLLPPWAALCVLVATGVTSYGAFAFLFRLPALEEIKMIASVRRAK